MTEGLAIYILMLMFFSGILTLKLVYTFHLIITRKFRGLSLVWPASSVLTIWFIVVTVQGIFKIAGGC